MYRSSASALTIGIALAGGILVAAPTAMAQSAFDGAYLGIQGGYSDVDLNPRSPITVDEADGFGGGVFAGFGRTFGSLYAGAEVELGLSGVDGEQQSGSVRTELDGKETYGAALRLGVLATDTLLAYGRVGYQWTKYDVESEIVGVAGTTRASASKTLDGLTFGAGLESAFADNLTARIEYVYTEQDRFDPVSIGGVLPSIKPQSHSGRIGIVYRF